MYLEHHARGGKISFEAMAKEWNSDLLTEIVMRPDNRTAMFSTMTMKCASQLKRFHSKLVDHIDNTFSRMSVSAQPRLAQATLFALATRQRGIDFSGSIGVDITPSGASPGLGGTYHLPGVHASTAGPSNSATAGGQQAGRGGPGGKKSCRLCHIIEGREQGIAGGHIESCKYQKMYRAVKVHADGGHPHSSHPSFQPLDGLLRKGQLVKGKMQTLAILYGAAWKNPDY